MSTIRNRRDWWGIGTGGLFFLFLMMLTVTLLAGPRTAHAGAGTGSSTNLDGSSKTVPTYYANSPAGTWTDWEGNSHDSGAPLRKFVDPLPGMCQNNGGTSCTGKYIPIAIPDTTTYQGSNYYEIAIVEYSQQMHSDLPKKTRLRGYVQLETAANAANSRHIPLTYPDSTPIKDINGNNVYALDNPTYLGPIIIASKGTPVRIKYMNLLPLGSSGDLFIPVDKTLMGAGIGPDLTTYYTENRAAIHLHGGDTPWISDGTPHQWTVPVGETNKYQTGVSFSIVPDMPDPGAGKGAGTLYYTNDISGRLMFYHDHALGTTRLNVYAGVAAGYLITDPAERALVPDAPEVPLVIQDKTFVPKDIVVQDAKWSTTHWGVYGDLWFPNVYEFNQDPASYDGTNPPGRWDYGPYFWPIFPVDPSYVIPDGTWDAVNNRSNATTTPEAFMDTPVINGMVYPYLNVEPKVYRFRILNASNDRMWNLGLYTATKAVDCTSISGGTGYAIGDQLIFIGGLDPTIPNAQPATATVSAVNNGAITGFQMNTFGTYASLPTGITSATGTGASFTCALSGVTEVAMVPFDASTPNIPTTGGLLGTGWGTPVGFLFPMGVPSPATIGPNIIQIGNEGGLLPAPAVIPSTPTNYEYNKRSVTVLNVLEHGLFLGAAERADIVVDFSAYAGKTLILYNDSPAPVPAGDDRIDYYTGDPDFTASGGAATTHPGIGPNTRTLMQIRVGSAVTTPSVLPATLAANVSAAYAATQPRPVVAETAYAPAFGAPNTSGTYARIATGSAYAPYFTFVAGSDISFYDFQAPPVIPVITPPPLKTTRTNVLQGQTVSMPVKNKAIQELFDPWGRMNATLGTEIPFTNGTNQTTIPLGYVDPGVIGTDGVVIDPATETIEDGETQIWKITHNGVDTHPVHFHLVNVQLINRVGWDGTVKPPNANEVGWKETIRMNPLEDIYVAVRANKPKLPFGVPNSSRALAPAEPAGSTMGFSNIDPVTGNAFNITAAPGVVTNQVADFGWEYVWHCHILGHEENDFMRPFVFKAPATIPDAPTGLNATINGTGHASLGWTDPTPVNYTDPTHATFGSAKNEIGFRVERSDNSGATYATLATVPANTTTYTDTTSVLGGQYVYRVTAFNAAGSTTSNLAPINIPTMIVHLTPAPASPQVVGASVQFTAAAVATGPVEYEFWVQDPGGMWTMVRAYSTTPTWTWTTGTYAAGTYNVAVNVRLVGSAVSRTAQSQVSYTLVPLSITSFTPTPASPQTVGTPVLFAAATNGATGTVEYEFWVQDPGGAWTMVRAYSTTPTWTWTTVTYAAGTYHVAVNVRLVGSTVSRTTQSQVSYTLVPLSITSFTPTPASPQTVGTPVLFTAATNGATGTVEYEFWVQDPGGAWTMVRAYSTTPTWTWTTGTYAAGTYNVVVNVRPVGSAVSRTTYSQVSYTLVPLSITSFTPTPASPRTVGTSVLFTAATNGATGTVAYEFWVQDPGGTWTMVRAYSTTPTWTWTTGTYAAGTYNVAVNVRPVGSAVSRTTYSQVPYQIN